MAVSMRPRSPSNVIANNSVTLKNTSQAIYQPLYDYQVKEAGATSQQSFFQVPIGQAGKTEADTNMQLAGQLPSGNMFLIKGIQVELYPAATLTGAALSEFANDVQKFYNSGVLVLSIGNKDFCTQAPLNKFPPVNYLEVDSSSGTDAVNTTYARAGGREFTVPEMSVTASQAFSVMLKDMPALSAPCKVGVTLNGYLYREAQ